MGTMTDETGHDRLRDQLLLLELALAERREADLPRGYTGVLHGAFREVGASGRLWTRAATLEALAGAEPLTVEMASFEIERLAEGVVLATYATLGGRPARRASIWVLDGGQWSMRYHQGTLL